MQDKRTIGFGRRYVDGWGLSWNMIKAFVLIELVGRGEKEDRSSREFELLLSPVLDVSPLPCLHLEVERHGALLERPRPFDRTTSFSYHRRVVVPCLSVRRTIGTMQMKLLGVFQASHVRAQFDWLIFGESGRVQGYLPSGWCQRYWYTRQATSQCHLNSLAQSHIFSFTT